MLQRSHALVPLVLVLGIAGAAIPAAAADAPPYVTGAVASTARPPQQTARDGDRKPVDVIVFSQIKRGDKVADLVPGDGYYTRILSKAIGASGMVYAYVPQRGFQSVQAARAEEEKQRAEGKPPQINPVDLVLPLQHTSDFKNIMVLYSNLMAFGGNLALPEQLDVVFVIRGYHELRNKANGSVNNAPVDMAAVNKAIFRVLKPGGTYIISDYAAPKGAGFDQSQMLNRIDADAVKQEVIAAGFAFEADTQVLANATDDHAKPANDDKADQFLMRFRKPASASAATKRLPLSVMRPYFGNTFVLGTPDDRGRTIFYHEDGTYQEFGINDMQLAHYFFDADGHNCMYHESPVTQEGFVTCHPFAQEHMNAKIGDVWVEQGGGPQGTKVSLVAGHQYPNRRPQPPAQNATASAGASTQGDTWDSIKLLPDWSGSWGDATRRRGGTPVDTQMPFNAATQAKVDAFNKLAAAGGDVTERTQNCYPSTFSGTMGGPEAYYEFLFTPGRVTITSENGLIRRIYTDGRKMPADPDETFHGFSVGHWEDTTLVVETGGLDRNNSLIGVANIPSGKGLHVMERIYLANPDLLQIDSTIEAPAVLTGPYKVTKQFARHRGYTMNEFNCQQNNRDVDKTGKQIFDLTPPDDLPPPPKN